jgi:hypothetical protein
MSDDSFITVDTNCARCGNDMLTVYRDSSPHAPYKAWCQKCSIPESNVAMGLSADQAIRRWNGKEH